MPLCNADIKQCLFNVCSIRMWNSLPSWAVDMQFLQAFKSVLAEVLRDNLFDF